jgi:hypothetical protein
VVEVGIARSRNFRERIHGGSITFLDLGAGCSFVGVALGVPESRTLRLVL